MNICVHFENSWSERWRKRRRKRGKNTTKSIIAVDIRKRKKNQWTVGRVKGKINSTTTYEYYNKFESNLGTFGLTHKQTPQQKNKSFAAMPKNKPKSIEKNPDIDHFCRTNKQIMCYYLCIQFDL